MTDRDPLEAAARRLQEMQHTEGGYRTMAAEVVRVYLTAKVADPVLLEALLPPSSVGQPKEGKK